jgi:predicted ATP-grasp superfamily ATP-dependent carboligase
VCWLLLEEALVVAKRSFLAFSGTNDRAVFALTRAFEACSVKYALITRNVEDRILLSDYRRHVLATRDNDELSLAILEVLLSKVRRTLPDDILVIVPNSEYLNTFLLSLDRNDLRDRLGCEVPLVERSLYMEFSNKLSSMQRFARAGIRVPAHLAQFDVDALPMIAKPIQNVGSDGIVRYPLLLCTYDDLQAFLHRTDTAEYFPQEFIQGYSQYLLAYIAKSGDVFLGSQRNLAQQPHGKSIVLASTSDFSGHPVSSASIDLLLDAGFYGFAMLEFIVDPQGPCFIEMNPRPWGPLQLCLDHRCGIVEAFIGDALYDDPGRYAHTWSSKPAQARYMWLGGMAAVLREGGSLHWDKSAGSRVGQLARGVISDVYLRRDSWKVFLREVLGR